MTINTDNYLPADIAISFPDKYSQEYWSRTAKGELAFQRCAVCKTFRHPAGPMCPNCAAFEDEWIAVAGRGSVYTFTIVTHAVHPALTASVPFNVVLVEFPDAPGVRLVTNLIDTEAEDITIGMPVEVIYEQTPNMTLPRVKRLVT
ncbi:Zn-ribbon domain-containing OB-fold protein [Jatrophihabitans sp. DSM 45814]